MILRHIGRISFSERQSMDELKLKLGSGKEGNTNFILKVLNINEVNIVAGK
jgi:hypothetical protein